MVLISFNQSVYSVAEGAGAVSLCVELSNVLEPTQRDVFAVVSTMSDTAVGKWYSMK